MTLLRTFAVVGAGCSIALAGCGAEPSDAAGATTPTRTPTQASSPATASPSVAATPVDGVWGLKQTRSDVVDHLEEYGFGDRVEEFVRAEQVWEVDQWEWTFDRGRFTARWLMPDEVWKVADHGSYDVQGPVVTLRFDSGDAGSSTAFRYRVDGDQLTLDWTAHQGQVEVKGLPDEAFWRAYLTKPLTRVS